MARKHLELPEGVTVRVMHLRGGRVDDQSRVHGPPRATVAFARGAGDRTAVGVSICHHGDQPSYVLGRNIAVGRAIRAFKDGDRFTGAGVADVPADHVVSLVKLLREAELKAARALDKDVAKEALLLLSLNFDVAP